MLIPLFLLVLALSASLAQAHAGLLEAEPAPGSRLDTSPAWIRLVFNEALLPESTFLVHGARFDLVPGLAPVVEGAMMRAVVTTPLARGRYTVEWKAVVEDGTTQGSYQFQVGPLVPAWAWGLGILAALALAAGAVVWRRRRR